MKKILITGGSGFIGTNLIDYLLENYEEVDILNVDVANPRNEHHKSIWKKVNILDKEQLSIIIESFKPSYVVHLAARPSLYGKSIEDFPEIVEGTKNLVTLCNDISSVKRFIHISTQLVCYPGVHPKSDDEYSPYTFYGLSKAESEKIIRSIDPNFKWLILRPTNIWGPWHSSYPYEMWPYLKKRYYMHPGYDKSYKYYGFVINVCYQISEFLFNIDINKINKKVFYTTDPKIPSEDYLNAFSIALSGKKINRIPRFIWYILASFGSLVKTLKINFPVDLGRYFRTIVSESLPVEKTIELMDYHTNAIKLDQSVKLTVDWLKNNIDEFKNDKKK